MYYLGSLLYLLSFDLLLCLFLLDFFCCSLLHFPFCDFLESLSFVVCLLYAYFALLCLICFALVLFCLFSFFLLFDSTLPFCLLRWLLCCVWLSFLGFDYFCTLYFLRFVLHWLPEDWLQVGWLEGCLDDWRAECQVRRFVGLADCLFVWLDGLFTGWLSCDVMICREVSWRVQCCHVVFARALQWSCRVVSYRVARFHAERWHDLSCDTVVVFWRVVRCLFCPRLSCRPGVVMFCRVTSCLTVFLRAIQLSCRVLPYHPLIWCLMSCFVSPCVSFRYHSVCC